MTPLVAVIVAIAVAFRVTRLFADDAVTDRIRQRLLDDERFTVVYWLSCYWCFGFYVSGAVAIIFSLLYSVVVPFWALWAILSVTTGTLGSIIRKLEGAH